jgi:LacI family transcriptional regulator
VPAPELVRRRLNVVDRPTRRPRVVDIAVQSGLSRATVDRVLHGRAGVRPETVAQVQRAVAELGRQRTQVQLSGQILLFDLVMQAPERFSTAARQALEVELTSLRPAVLRSRAQLSEHGDPEVAAAVLDRVAGRGSDGVILKAPDHPLVAAAVARLAERRIPVVTFVTDLPASRRTAYVGVDNRAAGATAAYLVSRWSGGSGPVLVTLSSSSFHGEEERVAGFRAAMQELAPHRRLHEATETHGLDATMPAAVRDALVAEPGIAACYSIGGGNRAIIGVFDELGRAPVVFVAHDLDAENRRLLRTRRISAVLHHDLRADMRRACRLLLQARGVLPGSPASVPSQIQVVTPYNEPSTLLAYRD